MNLLPEVPSEAIIFEDERLYVCLASFPLTKGHTVIVWKQAAHDLHLLNHEEYEYLMDIVSLMRDTLLKTLGVEKVYLMYMDEVNQVHWHLVPRYDEQGFNLLNHQPEKTTDFSLVVPLRLSFHDTSNKS